MFEHLTILTGQYQYQISSNFATLVPEKFALKNFDFLTFSWNVCVILVSHVGQYNNCHSPDYIISLLNLMSSKAWLIKSVKSAKSADK